MLTNEHRLIETIRTWTGGTFIGDDCAVLPQGLLITCDSLVERTHFRRDWTSFANIGWKSAAVNLSDIAAMAGRARYLTMSLTMPRNFKREQFAQMYKAFVECASMYRARVVGGDLTRGDGLVIAVTALGDVHECGVLKRSGARPGDAVVVTGDFGASAVALQLLLAGVASPAQRHRFAYLFARHERPLPRLCESWALVRKTGSRGSLMDASDGLADALVQIAHQSSVAMEIDFAKIPVHEQTIAAARELNLVLEEPILYGGEDYELVGTLPESVWDEWAGASGNPFARIGTVGAGKGVVVKRKDQPDLTLDLAKCFEQVGFS